MNESFAAELTAALEMRADEVTTQAIERVRTTDYHPRRHRRRTVTLWGTGSAAVTGAVVALAVGVFGPGVPNAFASWSPQTSSPAPDQVATAEQTCTAELLSMAQGLPSSPASSNLAAITWQPMLEDVRGSFTLVAFRSTGASLGQASCLTGGSSWSAGPQAMLSVSGEESVSITGSGNAGGGGPINEAVQGRGSATFGANSTPPSSGAVNDPSTNWNSNSNDQVALGQVGAGVTAVTLNLSDGTAVQTTVANGLYAAWWPGSTSVSSVSYTNAAGTFTRSLPSQPVVHQTP